MRPSRRWVLVGTVLVVLGALPAIIAAIPASAVRVSAADLLLKVQASAWVPYSGYAEVTGGLSLPVSGDFNGVTSLLGGDTHLRAWWRDDRDWRIDRIDPTGESDMYRDLQGTWTWDYESGSAVRATEPSVRLPRGADLLPPLLGRRLLSEAMPAEVSRLPATQIAGRDAPGLRLRPAQPESTVDHVDLWVDLDTGLPLRVSLYGPGPGAPAMSTSFLDFSTETPSARTTAFKPPAGTRVSFEDAPDLAAAINEYAPAVAPRLLAGLARRTTDQGLGGVGTYGRGVTVLVALPVAEQIADPLRTQLKAAPGVAQNSFGTAVQFGPIGLLVGESGYGGRAWLVAGTVTYDTLDRAVQELASGLDWPQ